MYEYLDGQEIMDIAKAGLKFYEREFDFPYPFAKCDQIFIQNLMQALENAVVVLIVMNIFSVQTIRSNSRA